MRDSQSGPRARGVLERAAEEELERYERRLRRCERVEAILGFLELPFRVLELVAVLLSFFA